MTMTRRRVVLAINIVLAVLIVLFIFLSYYKKKIVVNCEYNGNPGELYEIVSNRFPAFQKQPISLIFIFNTLP